MTSDPASGAACHELGAALADAGRWDEAIAALRRAVTLCPNDARVHNSLGGVLASRRQFDEARAHLERAIELDPGFAAAHDNLGNLLLDLDQHDLAVERLKIAVAADPASAEAHLNLGRAFAVLGRGDEAIDSYRRSIALEPNFSDSHAHLALALLLRGDFREGWREWEWRWGWRDFTSPPRRYAQPMWDGGELGGRTILLWSEQGFGDMIQFVRYVPLVAARGGRVILECEPELRALFENVAGAASVIVRGTPARFDVHCPLMSMCAVFGTTVETIPRDVRYLRADAARIEKWRRQKGGGMKIGLAWAGRAAHGNDRNRSMAFSMFAPLADAAPAGATFHSLQLGDAARQVSGSPMRMVDCAPEFSDFAETAGLIANLDLVITVDTAVAHLAGALGKPVWTMIPFIPDWRWLMDRADSPWYPTMRLFRQRERGDWRAVVEDVARSLREMAGSSA